MVNNVRSIKGAKPNTSKQNKTSKVSVKVDIVKNSPYKIPSKPKLNRQQPASLVTNKVLNTQRAPVASSNNHNTGTLVFDNY